MADEDESRKPAGSAEIGFKASSTSLSAQARVDADFIDGTAGWIHTALRWVWPRRSFDAALIAADAKAETSIKAARAAEQVARIETRTEIVRAQGASLIDRIRSDSLTSREQVVLERILDEGIEKMERRDFVVQEANQLLITSGAEQPKETPDPDLLNRILNDSAEVSSDQARRLYARLLAGECVKPGSISKRLLNVIRLLSKSEAAAFQALANLVLESKAGGFLFVPGVALHFPKMPESRLVDELSALGLLETYTIGEGNEKQTLEAQYHGLEGRFAHHLSQNGWLMRPMTMWILMGTGRELFDVLEKNVVDGYINFLKSPPFDVDHPFIFQAQER